MARPKLSDKEKLKRKKTRMMTVKAEQVGICRFVEVQMQEFANAGAGKCIRTGSKIAQGLQYENKVLFEDGSFKWLNTSTIRIIKIYERPPKGASDYLFDLYTQYVMFDIPIYKG